MTSEEGPPQLRTIFLRERLGPRLGCGMFRQRALLSSSMMLNACLLGVLLWQSQYIWRRVRRARQYDDALLERVNLEALRQTRSAELNSSHQIIRGGKRNSTRKYHLWSIATDLHAHVHTIPPRGINRSHVATQGMSNTSVVRRGVHVVNGTSNRPGLFWESLKRVRL